MIDRLEVARGSGVLAQEGFSEPARLFIPPRPLQTLGVVDALRLNVDHYGRAVRVTTRDSPMGFEGVFMGVAWEGLPRWIQPGFALAHGDVQVKLGRGGGHYRVFSYPLIQTFEFGEQLYTCARCDLWTPERDLVELTDEYGDARGLDVHRWDCLAGYDS